MVSLDGFLPISGAKAPSLAISLSAFRLNSVRDRLMVGHGTLDPSI